MCFLILSYVLTKCNIWWWVEEFVWTSFTVHHFSSFSEHVNFSFNKFLKNLYWVPLTPYNIKFLSELLYNLYHELLISEVNNSVLIHFDCKRESFTLTRELIWLFIIVRINATAHLPIKKRSPHIKISAFFSSSQIP